MRQEPCAGCEEGCRYLEGAGKNGIAVKDYGKDARRRSMHGLSSKI